MWEKKNIIATFTCIVSSTMIKMFKAKIPQFSWWLNSLNSSHIPLLTVYSYLFSLFHLSYGTNQFKTQVQEKTIQFLGKTWQSLFFWI